MRWPTASMMLENTTPVMKSTLSRLMRRSAVCLATSGLMLVVGHDHFGGQATELAAGVLDGQLEAVTDVHAQTRAGARQRAQQAHLDVVGGMCTTRPASAAAATG
jgi:hypothetical protein